MDSLKNRSVQLILLIHCFTLARGQKLELNLMAANSQIFSGVFYSFGIKSDTKETQFYVYKLNLKLQVLDSLVFNYGKSMGESFLQCSSDTLHGFLNVYVQQKEKNQLTVFRFNKNFELQQRIENIDIARLNNSSTFGNEIYYSGKEVYSIKTQSDTSGIQFYLNKYTLKSETKNFDYEFIWQFPFERKNIQSAHIFYATKQFVLIFVHVGSKEKTGQWILKINAQNGQLIRGSKLNDKGEDKVYLFGDFVFESNSKTLLLMGEKLNLQQFQTKENKLAVSGSSVIPLYIIRIDSIGDVLSRQDFKLPIAETKTSGKKPANAYLLQIHRFQKTAEGEYSFESDLYKSVDKFVCYTYCNSFLFHIKTEDDKLQLEKKTLSTQPLIESFLFSNDKLDMNGKLCANSTSRIEQLFYEEASFPVKLEFKPDSLARPKWILSKSNLHKASISYHILKAGKINYELKSLEEIPKANQPRYFRLNQESSLISNQITIDRYLLKIFTW